jgi:hypothetical protein
VNDIRGFHLREREKKTGDQYESAEYFHRRIDTELVCHLPPR